LDKAKDWSNRLSRFYWIWQGSRSPTFQLLWVL